MSSSARATRASSASAATSTISPSASQTKNSYALAAYGRSCIEILHRNWQSLDSEVITIGLVQGDALGGGFESLLSFDIIVAEKGTKFGFPEQLFGLFPGMGALTFLGRKLGTAKAEWLVRTGKTMTAEELYELGIVHVLAEPGQGIEAVKPLHRQERPAPRRAVPHASGHEARQPDQLRGAAGHRLALGRSLHDARRSTTSRSCAGWSARRQDVGAAA